MNTQEMTPEQKIQAWFDNPNTPENAWKEWTIEKLCEVCNVSSSSILKYLADIVKAKYPEIENFLKFRQVRQEVAQNLYKKGERLPDSDIQKIQELRKEHTIHETAALTGFSPATVHRYSKPKTQQKE